MRIFRYRAIKFKPRLATTYRPHGKWGDLIVCLLPVSWCLNIITNSNFILRMIEWQAESSLFTLRIRGKQWYWVYKYELKAITDVLTAPKNIGNNKWVISNPLDLQVADDFLHIHQLRAQSMWVQNYWTAYKETDIVGLTSTKDTSAFLYGYDFYRRYTEAAWNKQLIRIIKPVFSNVGMDDIFDRLSEKLPTLQTAIYTHEALEEEKFSIENTLEAEDIDKLFNIRELVFRPVLSHRKAWKIIPSFLHPQFSATDTPYTSKFGMFNSDFSLLNSPFITHMCKPAEYKLGLGLLNDVLNRDASQLIGFENTYKPARMIPSPHLRMQDILNACNSTIVDLHFYNNTTPDTSDLFFLHEVRTKQFIDELAGVEGAPVVNHDGWLYALAGLANTYDDLLERLVLFTKLDVMAYKPNFVHHADKFDHASIESISKFQDMCNFKWVSEIDANLTPLVDHFVSQKGIPTFVFENQMNLGNYGNAHLDVNNLKLITPEFYPTLALKVDAPTIKNFFFEKKGFALPHDASFEQMDLKSFYKNNTQATFFKDNDVAVYSTAFPHYSTRDDFHQSFLNSRELLFFKFGGSYYHDDELDNEYVFKLDPSSFNEARAVLQEYFRKPVNNIKGRSFGHSESHETSFNAQKGQSIQSPVRIIKFPLNFIKEHQQDEIIELFRLRFGSGHQKVEQKANAHQTYWIFRQKRYKRVGSVKNRVRYYMDWQGRPTERVYLSYQPYVDKNRLVMADRKSHMTHYEIIKTARRRSENIALPFNKRLLRTRRIVVLPAHVNIAVITNSFDVVHSWFIPGLGIKMDCIPGRSTHHVLHIDNVGFYYGQCAEICGRYHHHMPIRICALPFEHFMVWWHAFAMPRLLKAYEEPLSQSKKDRYFYASRKYVW